MNRQKIEAKFFKMGEKDLSLLVVDDNDNDRLLITEALLKNNVNIQINYAISGSNAISYLKGEGQYNDRGKFPYPSVILCDLNMPNGDGYSVLHHLENNNNKIKTPIFIVSSSRNQQDINRSYMLGACGYFEKPIQFSDMLDLMKVLSGLFSKFKLPREESAAKI